MEIKPGDFNRLREVFAGKGVLLSGKLSSAVERLCFYFAFDALRNNKKECVVWVSTDYSYEKAVGMFKEYDIDIRPYLDRFLFVDLITLKSGARAGDSKNVKYVQDPGNLTELSLAISEHVDSRKCGLVVIHLLNSMLVYNDLERSMEFIRILNARAYDRKFAFLGAFIEGEQDVKAEVSMQIAVDVIAKVSGKDIHIITPTEVHSFSFEFKKGKLLMTKKQGIFSREEFGL
ncbi:Uncharacterised protein [Candidatus Burarchaeum australiense]|nr:Uncharacterised protein [Candidatus Burarchaeum australiense]